LHGAQVHLRETSQEGTSSGWQAGQRPIASVL
jgi:hypothetical protein